MAVQRSASSTRAAAKAFSTRAAAQLAQRRAQRAQSLSGSMRQFLTPQVWKPVRHTATQHGCRKGLRWTLQPLLMIATIMTWCAGQTDADRFVLSRAFYVPIHAPKRQRPGKAFSGFGKAMLRLPMPVWWAFCDAVRSRVFHLVADRMTLEGWLPLGCDGSRLEGPRTAELEPSLGQSSQSQAAPTLWVIALVSLTTGVLWSWRLGSSKTGERRYLIDLLETLPQAVIRSVLLVCDAGYVGYDLLARLLKQQCSFLIRLSSQAQLYSLEMVEVEGFTEGEFWYWTDDAERKSQPALRVRVIRVAAPKRKNDVWLVTNVLDPKRLSAGLAARFYKMRWESECFFRTDKRVVKDVRLVSRTVPLVVREAEVSLLACQLLLGQGALAWKVGGQQAGRDELKCSAAAVLREIRRELEAARKPMPRSSFAQRLQQTGRDRRERTGPKMKRQPPRRKKHEAPQPPRLKVLSAEQKRQIDASKLKEAAA
jgi:Transposase DDE domain